MFACSCDDLISRKVNHESVSLLYSYYSQDSHVHSLQSMFVRNLVNVSSTHESQLHPCMHAPECTNTNTHINTHKSQYYTLTNLVLAYINKYIQTIYFFQATTLVLVLLTPTLWLYYATTCHANLHTKGKSTLTPVIA